MPIWSWLTQSTAGLALRIAIGVLVFAVLALHDLRKNGNRATRWREYSFLLLSVDAAMIYGVVNDQITSALSWEYFYYGKELSQELGPQIPPDPLKLHLAAAVVGIKATWSAGLLIGVALLFANNPSSSFPRLRNRALLKQLPLLLTITAMTAALGALAGQRALPTLWNADFAEMLRRDEMRPRRFMTAYGIHLGGYVGGLIGTIVAIVRIRRERRASLSDLHQSR